MSIWFLIIVEWVLLVVSLAVWEYLLRRRLES